MTRLFSIVLFLLSFSNRVFAQLTADSIHKNYNTLPLSELIHSLESGGNVKFFYLNKWIDTVHVVQRETPTTIEQVLKDSFKNSGLSYFVENQRNIIITEQYIIESASLSVPAGENQASLPMDKAPDTSSRIESSFIRNEQKRPLPVVSQNEQITIGVPGSVSRFSKAIISGKIREKETDQPIIGAVIFVKSLNLGVVSDAFGYYILSIPPGKYELTVKCVGRKDQTLNIVVNGSGTLDVMLEEMMVELRGVIISAEKEQNIRGLQLGVEKLNIQQIKLIPSTLGEVDLIKTVLLLPGVQTVGEGASGFNVRGGTTDQNLILMDGAPLFNSSHMFGFYSVFNPDVVKEFELYKSSIPAQYGGRLSSVLDITIMEGNLKKINVTGGVSPIAGRLSLDGPILKDKATFLLSGRSTYSNWVLRRTGISSLRKSTASFLDLNGKIKFKINNNNQLILSSYYSSDQFRLRSDTLYNYSNMIGSINLRHTFSKTLYGLFSGIYSNYNYSMSSRSDSPYSFDLSYYIKYLEAKADIAWFMNANHKLRFGAEIINYRINPAKLDSVGSGSRILPKKLPDENVIETGIFISDEHTLTKELSLSYGLRYSGFFSVGPEMVYKYLPDAPRSLQTRIDSTYYPRNKISFHAGGPEFRFAARYKTGASSSVKISYTRMFQYIQMLSNTTAISPTDIWTASGSNLPVQKSRQYSIGFYKNLMSNKIDASVELYFKTFKNILEYRGGAILLANPDLEVDLLNGIGKAYGIEVLFEKKYGALNGWLGYTYSRSMNKVDSKFLEDQINEGNYYPSNYDKPNDFTLVASYRFSRVHSLSATIKYSTGRPITYPAAKYHFSDRELIHYSNRNEYRIPDYFRVDVSYNFNGSVKADRHIINSMSFSIYNLTGRKNAYSIYFLNDPVRKRVKGYKLSIFSRQIFSITYNFMF
jgi:hypothetical protein